MFLSASNLADYLIERGLVDPGSVVDGDWMVFESSRRNRNFKVLRQRHPGLFVKQIQQWEPQAIATLQSEAKCYWLTLNNPAFAPLAPLLPRYFDFDPARYVLVLGLLKDGEDLAEHHRRLDAFPPVSAAQLAHALAAYHRIAPDSSNDSNGGGAGFAKKIPWILSVDQFTASSFSAMSGGNSQMIGIVQQYPDFQRSLQALRSDWRYESLIHGDLKWDNCVVENGKEAPSIKIVDWELADWGDACWDVGAILQAYLSFWVFSMPAAEEVPTTDLVKRAQHPVESMQPALRAFWKGYVEARGIERQDAAVMLERSVRCGAARMIQTAYEYMYYSAAVSANILCLLQVSLNILSRPEEAIRELLGL